MLMVSFGGQVIRMVGESTEAVGAGVGGGSSGNKMPTLEEYGTNLTKLAEEVILRIAESWFCACHVMGCFVSCVSCLFLG